MVEHVQGPLLFYTHKLKHVHVGTTTVLTTVKHVGIDYKCFTHGERCKDHYFLHTVKHVRTTTALHMVKHVVTTTVLYTVEHVETTTVLHIIKHVGTTTVLQAQ